MKTIFALLVLLALLSCGKEPTTPASTIEAVFVFKDTRGCRLPLVNITRGGEQARRIARVNDNYQSDFSLNRLDSIYWKPGKAIRLTIRPLSDFIVCDTQGFNYPAIEVESMLE